MLFKPKKTPYQGLWAFILYMTLPSLACTLVSYYAFMEYQGQFSQELNLASAKIIGCGIGAVFHLSCWIMGAFTEDFGAVKYRLKEFLSNVSVSLGSAFKWYIDDVKTYGLAFWIDLSIVGLNLWIFIDALSDYLSLRGTL